MAASMDFMIQVTNSLSGDVLLEKFPGGAETGRADILAKLPTPPVGSGYQLFYGEQLWSGATPLADLLQELDLAGGRKKTDQKELTLNAVVTAVFKTQSEGDLKLIEAADKLDQQQVELLLSAKANPAYRDEPEGVWGSANSKTALHAAILASNRTGADHVVFKNIVTGLLHARADPNAVREYRNWKGSGSSETAFQLITWQALRDVELFQMFMDAGANPSVKKARSIHSMRSDGYEQGYLIHEVVELLDEGSPDTEERSLEFARLLLEARADPNAEKVYRCDNERGYNQDALATPLYMACKRGSTPMAALLLRYGANVNTECRRTEHIDVDVSDRVTHDPRAAGYIPDVRCVNVRDSALIAAILSKKVPLVQLLVAAGASKTSGQNRDGDVLPTVGFCGCDEDLLDALKAPASLDELEQTLGSAWEDAKVGLDKKESK